MKTLLRITVLIAALAPFCATAAPAAKTPPGTCSIAFGPQAIPGDSGHTTTVIHMNIAPGRTANWHTHSGVEYLNVNSGSGSVEFERRPSVALSPGKVVMIPANTAHRIHNGSATQHITWSVFLVSPVGRHDYTTLRHNDTAWTPGCPRRL